MKACKEIQTDPDFVVIARVEALSTGWDMDEALRRAEAYRNAGADGVLIHTPKNDTSDIEEFMKRWNNQASESTWIWTCGHKKIGTNLVL